LYSLAGKYTVLGTYAATGKYAVQHIHSHVSEEHATQTCFKNRYIPLSIIYLSIHPIYLYTIYTLSIYYLYSIYTLSIFYLNIIYTISIRYLYTKYIYTIYTLSTNQTICIQIRRVQSL
jgi:hypothetical protein